MNPDTGLRARVRSACALNEVMSQPCSSPMHNMKRPWRVGWHLKTFFVEVRRKVIWCYTCPKTLPFLLLNWSSYPFRTHPDSTIILSSSSKMELILIRLNDFCGIHFLGPITSLFFNGFVFIERFLLLLLLLPKAVQNSANNYQPSFPRVWRAWPAPVTSHERKPTVQPPHPTDFHSREEPRKCESHSGTQCRLVNVIVKCEWRNEIFAELPSVFDGASNDVTGPER